METRRIPIFPLNVVLFPGMMLPLHIFEPRYREMVRHCLEGDRTFGVCLIASGTEVGGPAEPEIVGTTCEIQAVEPLDDGRMHLITFGGERFRICRLIREAAYLEAEIEPFPEAPPADVAYLVETAREAADRFIRDALEAQGEAEREFDLPEDPVALANLIGSVLPAPAAVRQELLEAPIEERLRRGLEVLEAENRRAEDPAADGRIVAHPFSPKRPPSLN
jgi:Lon protease-like protein